MDFEFRIPIAPRPAFFAQVEFFNFRLRSLGGQYRFCPLHIYVGEKCDLDAVRAQNAWSTDWPVFWHRVPDAVFDRYDMYGTANSRFLGPEPSAGTILFCDADTVLVREIGDLSLAGVTDHGVVTGHMAHYPPEENGPTLPPSTSEQYWPELLARFGLAMPDRLQRYSCDTSGRFPLSPPYFNLGVIAMNRRAFDLIAGRMDPIMDRLGGITQSFMRCQLALSIACLQGAIETKLLDARFNAANDPLHASLHGVTAENVRILHYLRGARIDRNRIGEADYVRSLPEAGELDLDLLLRSELLKWHTRR
ncbi:hypothetical protein [Phreatobacter cathodiphilus]|uniref:Glycosyl transferase n=1 Tax=Phreatobacter cathodiphilus TaxID=1868589 RepID=A0A2S0NBW1_9HYPH|nr:hypothetical protein [Phreatobacter cathodiphilus]AVO45527.1 hypothetical protein C6569_10875 [Phreatobacter cathodiphilus]